MSWNQPSRCRNTKKNFEKIFSDFFKRQRKNKMPIVKRTTRKNPEPYKWINLSNGFSCKVSISDAQAVSDYNWFAKKSFSKVYACTWTRENGKRKLLFMHRFIAKTPINLLCHHDNTDSLDNRRTNLKNITEYDHIKLHSWR